MGSQAVRHTGAGWPGWRRVPRRSLLLTAIGPYRCGVCSSGPEGAALADPAQNIRARRRMGNGLQRRYRAVPASRPSCHRRGPCAEGIDRSNCRPITSLSVPEQILVLTDMERWTEV